MYVETRMWKLTAFSLCVLAMCHLSTSVENEPSTQAPSELHSSEEIATDPQGAPSEPSLSENKESPSNTATGSSGNPLHHAYHLCILSISIMTCCSFNSEWILELFERSSLIYVLDIQWYKRPDILFWRSASKCFACIRWPGVSYIEWVTRTY